jgi:hypothetical protein
VYERIAHNPWVSKLQEARNKIYDARLLALDPKADLIFYFTYFLISTLFSILTTLCILRIFEMKTFFVMSDQLKMLITMLITFFIGITQFVITPYDVMGYFFMTICLVFFLKHVEKKTKIYGVLLYGSIALATLVRESSLIVLCFMGAVYIYRYGLMNMQWIQKMIGPALAYFIPYAALRLYFTGEKRVFQDITFLQNFQFQARNLIAWSFFLVFLYLCFNLASGKENRNLILTFLLLAIPYLLIIFTVGLIIEIRLWMPLILGATLLAFMYSRSLSLTQSKVQIRPASS